MDVFQLSHVSIRGLLSVLHEGLGATRVAATRQVLAFGTTLLSLLGCMAVKARACDLLKVYFGGHLDLLEGRLDLFERDLAVKRVALVQLLGALLPVA